MRHPWLTKQQQQQQQLYTDSWTFNKEIERGFLIRKCTAFSGNVTSTTDKPTQQQPENSVFGCFDVCDVKDQIKKKKIGPRKTYKVRGRVKLEMDLIRPKEVQL